MTGTSGRPGPEVPEPRPAVIATAAHSNFCSRVRHRPVSALPPPGRREIHLEGLGWTSGRRALPWLSPSRPASFDRRCGRDRRPRPLTPHQPALAAGRPSPQKPRPPHVQGGGHRATWMGSERWPGLGWPALGLPVLPLGPSGQMAKGVWGET